MFILLAPPLLWVASLFSYTSNSFSFSYFLHLLLALVSIHHLLKVIFIVCFRDRENHLFMVIQLGFSPSSPCSWFETELLSLPPLLWVASLLTYTSTSFTFSHFILLLLALVSMAWSLKLCGVRTNKTTFPHRNQRRTSALKFDILAPCLCPSYPPPLYFGLHHLLRTHLPHSLSSISFSFSSP
jgi:hypothetical protein